MFWSMYPYPPSKYDSIKMSNMFESEKTQSLTILTEKLKLIEATFGVEDETHATDIAFKISKPKGNRENQKPNSKVFKIWQTWTFSKILQIFSYKKRRSTYSRVISVKNESK